jgi:hypothetical protein
VRKKRKDRREDGRGRAGAERREEGEERKREGKGGN